MPHPVRAHDACIFQACAKNIWDDIVSGAALADTSLLNRFALFTYADLKKFKFYYWFGFPALKGGGIETPTSAPQRIGTAISKSCARVLCVCVHVA